MKKNKAKLKAVIKEMSQVIDKYQAKAAMKELTRLLAMKSLTDADRKNALLMLRQLMRTTILSHAEALYIDNPTLYPSYIKVLFEEIERLKETYNAPEATESDVERYLELPSFDAVGEMTPENIQDFFTYAYSAFADNAELSGDGYTYLRFLSEQEIICQYVTIASSLPSLTWHESYVLILYMAVDMTFIDNYPIDCCYFYGAFVEALTPWNVASELSIKKLRVKLQVLFNAFEHMDSQTLNMFVNELEVNLISGVIEDYINAMGGTEALPADVSYLLECLDEVMQPLEDSTGDAGPNEADSIETLTTATEMLHFLCTHRDNEFLKNDWAEFNTALTSPIFGGIMRMRAHETIAVHILNYILECVDVSEAAKCKIRLYLALTLSPGIALCGNYVLDWIMGKTAEKQ